MDKISTLNSSQVKRVMLYKYDGDDGLLAEWSHGRFQWYRVDTGQYINIDNYELWREA